MAVDDDHTPKTETFTCRLPAGTHKRIARLLRGGELHSDFVREAVLALEAQREAEQVKK